MGHPTPIPAERPAGYLELLRENVAFRYLWLGQVVSLLGDWFTLIASAGLVTRLSDSGLAVGGLLVLRMLAPFLVGPLAGVAADRYNRKRLLIFSDLGRALVVFSFLLVRDAGDIWLLFVLTGLQFGLSGLFYPARSAILPDITTGRELVTANIISSTTWSVMAALGAALGGLAAGFLGPYPAFTIDALTFVGSALLVGRMAYRPRRDESGRSATVGAALREYVDGLRFLRRFPDILAIGALKGWFALGVGGIGDVVLVRISEKVFVYGQEGGTGLGLMFMAIGIGSGMGPIAARRIAGDRERTVRRLVAAGFFINMLGVVLIAPLASFGLVLVGLAIRSIGGGLIWVLSTQLMLQLVPENVRGRVFATEFMIFTLMYSVSATLGGWLLEATSLGASGSLWLMAAVMATGGLLWCAWNTRRREPVPLPGTGD